VAASGAGPVVAASAAGPVAAASGADPVAAASGAGSVVVAAVRDRLRLALRRTEWELRANRAGELSPPQWDQLRRQARGRVWARLAGITVGTLVAGLFLVATILADSLVGGVISAVPGLVAAGLTVRGLVRLPRAVFAVGHPPALLHASGTVTVKQTDGENDVWSVAVDGGPTFSVASVVARAFRTPLIYAVYFVQRSRDDAVLLAAEPMASSPEPARSWPPPTRWRRTPRGG
jgi:hypothetical protein